MFACLIGLKLSSYAQSARKLEIIFMPNSFLKIIYMFDSFCNQFLLHSMVNSTLRLISLNVNGVSNFKKRRMIYTRCRKKFIYSISARNSVNKRNRILWRNEWVPKFRCLTETRIHSKIIDPQGSFSVLKVGFKVNICLYQCVCSKQR